MNEKFATFKFRNKYLKSDYSWLDKDTLVFQFGEGEIKDKNGDECFVLGEYHYDTEKFIIQVWYEDDAFTIYSQYEDSELDNVSDFFELSEKEVNNIIERMQEIMQSKKEIDNYSVDNDGNEEK